MDERTNEHHLCAGGCWPNSASTVGSLALFRRVPQRDKFAAMFCPLIASLLVVHGSLEQTASSEPREHFRSQRSGQLLVPFSFPSPPCLRTAGSHRICNCFQKGWHSLRTNLEDGWGVLVMSARSRIPAPLRTPMALEIAKARSMTPESTQVTYANCGLNSPHHS